MKFDPTKKYKTLDGKEYRYGFSEDDGIYGWIKYEGRWSGYSFFDTDPIVDLIEVPEKKTRPMTFEEIPLDAWFRSKPGGWHRVVSLLDHSVAPLLIGGQWFTQRAFSESFTSYTLDDPRKSDAVWLPLEVEV